MRQPKVIILDLREASGEFLENLKTEFAAPQESCLQALTGTLEGAFMTGIGALAFRSNESRKFFSSTPVDSERMLFRLYKTRLVNELGTKMLQHGIVDVDDGDYYLSGVVQQGVLVLKAKDTHGKT